MCLTDLIEELKSGKTFQDVVKEKDIAPVECIKNEVYEDEDLYEFLLSYGAEIVDYMGEYVIISSEEGFAYKIPCEDRENRFGDDLPDETILFFDTMFYYFIFYKKCNY